MAMTDENVEPWHPGVPQELQLLKLEATKLELRNAMRAEADARAKRQEQEQEEKLKALEEKHALENKLTIRDSDDKITKTL